MAIPPGIPVKHRAPEQPIAQCVTTGARKPDRLHPLAIRVHGYQAADIAEFNTVERNHAIDVAQQATSSTPSAPAQPLRVSPRCDDRDWSGIGTGQVKNAHLGTASANRLNRRKQSAIRRQARLPNRRTHAEGSSSLLQFQAGIRSPSRRDATRKTKKYGEQATTSHARDQSCGTHGNPPFSHWRRQLGQRRPVSGLGCLLLNRQACTDIAIWVLLVDG